MVVQVVSLSACDPAERSLETGIVERVDPPALRADQMVMVVAAGIGSLEACDAVPEVDPVDEPELGQLLEGPVNAREPHGPVPGAEPVEHLLRGQAAVLRCEIRDHGVAGTARAGTCVPKLFARMLRPGRRILSHPENGNDSRLVLR